MSYNCVVRCLYTHQNWEDSCAQMHTLPVWLQTLLTFMTAHVNGRKRLFRVELKKSSRLMLVCLRPLLPHHLRPVFRRMPWDKAPLAVYYSSGHLSVSSGFHIQSSTPEQKCWR